MNLTSDELIAIHTEQRAKERYGIELSEADRQDMVSQVKTGRGLFFKKKDGSSKVSIWLVWWNAAARIVPVYYKAGRVLTVLPTDAFFGPSSPPEARAMPEPPQIRDLPDFQHTAVLRTDFTPALATPVPELGSSVVNDACWKFVETMPHQLPGLIFNDVKPAIYAAICHVLQNHPAPAPAQHLRGTIRQLRWDDKRVNHQALGPFGFIWYVTKSADFDGYTAGRLGDFDTLAEAKAAVQAHFEKGILAAFEDAPSETNMDELTIALARLAEHGVPVDIQELLIHGNVSLGVPPGALAAALSAAPSPSLHLKGQAELIAKAIWDTHELGDWSEADNLARGYHLKAAHGVIAALAPSSQSKMLALGDMPSYGNCTANDMLAAVADAIFGDRDISLLRQIDNDRPVGHQMVPNINFNSLNRIISAFHSPAPEKLLEPLGYISAYGLGKLQTRRHYCVSVSHQAEKEFIIPIFREGPATSPNLAGISEAAEFLCQRLEGFERELEDDEVGRQYYGHVHPAFSRLVAALTTEGQP